MKLTLLLIYCAFVGLNNMSGHLVPQPTVRGSSFNNVSVNLVNQTLL